MDWRALLAITTGLVLGGLVDLAVRRLIKWLDKREEVRSALIDDVEKLKARLDKLEEARATSDIEIDGLPF